MCCRCYQLGYQTSAAAPYTALNGGSIQCNVEAVHMFSCLRCSCACLSTSLHCILRLLLGCYDLLHSHYCWTECTSTESTNLFSGPYYCIILKCVITRVQSLQCTSLVKFSTRSNHFCLEIWAKSDWFYVLSTHLTFLFCSTAGFVCTVC